MRIYIFFVLLIPHVLLSQITADKVLSRAVNYHDQEGKWTSLNAVFKFTETRPSGPDRFTTIELDNSKSYMKINRNDEEMYEVNGEIAEVLKGDQDNERALILRNYYLYLWGLPMKLNDKSTPEITVVDDEKVDDTTCNVLRVAYEKDTWYFYFETESGRMLQYKFYKDEVNGKGELISLEDEIAVQGIKIPQKRSWYTLPEMKYLGTDILSRAE